MAQTQAGAERSQRAVVGWRPGVGLRLAGAALLAATGAIHLDLYVTGYRTIPIIGWLFLLQIISAFGLAAAVIVLRSRLACAAGAVFALSTLAGYLLAVWVGLNGFKEVRTTAGIVAGLIEVAAFAALATCSVAGGLDSRPARAIPGIAGRLAGHLPPARTAAAGVASASVAALALLGAAVAGAGAPAPAVAGNLRTTVIAGTRVLSNARGFTLYWFAPDAPAASKCYGSCAAYWPAVPGPVAAPGIPGRLGTIKRTDGTVQATYNGHPLYTYAGDSRSGQAHGNGLRLNGGLWHEVTVRG